MFFGVIFEGFKSQRKIFASIFGTYLLKLREFTRLFVN